MEQHLSEDGRYHSQKSPPPVVAWQRLAKWELCFWISSGWSAMLNRIVVWKMGTGIIQLHFQKEANTPFEKKSQNCHIFDSRVTKLFRSFLPHGNLCKIHFVDEALCVLCGRACIDYLDIDLYSACHLRLTGKAKAAINVLPLLHSPLSYMHAGDHISCHITQWRWGCALMLYVSYIYYTHTCSA